MGELGSRFVPGSGGKWEVLVEGKIPTNSQGQQVYQRQTKNSRLDPV